LALKWEDLDLVAGRLTVRSETSHLVESGGPDARTLHKNLDRHVQNG